MFLGFLPLVWLLRAALATAYQYSITYEPWPEQGDRAETAQLGDFDLARPIPVSARASLGVNLTALVFANQGVSTDAVKLFASLLDIGIGVFSINLYWNEYTQRWQLCPYPFNKDGSVAAPAGSTWQCDPAISLVDLVVQLQSYHSLTNTEYTARFSQFVLQLQQIPKRRNATDIATTASHGNRTIAELFSMMRLWVFPTPELEAPLGTVDTTSLLYLYFPTLGTFLRDDQKRLVLSVGANYLDDSDDGYQPLGDDRYLIFFNDDWQYARVFNTNDRSNLPNCPAAIAGNLSAFRAVNSTFTFISDWSAHNELAFSRTDVNTYTRCGMLPILSQLTHISEIENYIPFGHWSWAPGQPLLTNDTANLTVAQDGDDLIEAYRCVALYDNGFAVLDCYDEHHFACQSDLNLLVWTVDRDSDPHLYFDGVKDNICPRGYLFSVPRLPWDLHNLAREVRKQGIDYPVWIDFNDVTVADCFVTGGPYAQCPYKTTSTPSQLVKSIAPSFSVSVFLLLLFLAEKFWINPIQTNRKAYWRRRIHEYNENNNFEGVPS